MRRTVVVLFALALAGCVSQPKPWLPDAPALDERAGDSGRASADLAVDTRTAVDVSDAAGDTVWADAVDVGDEGSQEDMGETHADVQPTDSSEDAPESVVPDIMDTHSDTPSGDTVEPFDTSTDVAVGDASEPDDAVEPEDLSTSDACSPDCDGKECGADGCGGSCGTCAGPQDACVEGACLCVPACAGKECGDNGCGGSCGDCEENEECTDGQCVCIPSCPQPCVEDGCGGICQGCECGEECVEGSCKFTACDGKECGADGCGSSCGECQADSICLGGSCCTPDCTGKECGDNGCGGNCGDCAECGTTCVAGECAFTACDGKECGSDGCGGSCGECGENELCDMGLCFCSGASCGDICCPPGTTCATGYCCEPDCQAKSCGSDGCGGTCGGCVGALVCFDFTCADAGTECDDGNGDDYDGCTQGYVTAWRVDEESLLAQGDPDVAVLSDGSFVVVWTSLWYEALLPLVPADGDGKGVFSRRFSGNGTPLGPAIAVNTTTEGDQDDPHVAALTSGGFVVVWVSDGEDGDGMGIFARRFAADGTPSDAFKVNLVTGGNQMHPEVASLPDGGFVVAWDRLDIESDIYSGRDVAFRRYGGDGFPLGGEVKANTYSVSSQYEPSIDSRPDGSFGIAWTGHYDGEKPVAIYAQLFGVSGQPSGGEAMLNNHFDVNLGYTDVAAAADGAYLVVYESGGATDDPRDVVGRFVDSGGQWAADEFVVNTTLASNQFRASVAANPLGGFLVTYESYEGDPTAVELRGRFVDSDGVVIGEDFLLNKSLFGYHLGPPGIDFFPDGRFVMTWSMSKQISTYLTAMAALFDATGEMIPVGQQ